MENQNQVIERISSLFNNEENQQNLKLFHKFLSNPSRGFSLCQVITGDQQKILNFFKSQPLIERIHGINMTELSCSTMELQKKIIDVHETPGNKKDIFFIYNLEGCIEEFNINADDFFQGLNLIRDFFMHFEDTFVFFLTESSQKKMIQNAIDFNDWMKFTFIFVPEKEKLLLQPMEIEAYEEEKYSNPLQKIKYLENSIKKITDEKEKSLRLLELGTLYHQVEWDDNALEQVRQSLKIEESPGIKEENRDYWKGIAKRYALLGLIYKSKHKPNKALEFAHKAAKIFTEKNQAKDLAVIYNNIASIYRDKNDLDKELEFANKALEIFKTSHDFKGLAISYSIISRINRDKKDLDKALENCKSAVENFEKINDLPNLAKSYNNMGVIYQAQGNFDLALESVNKALEIFENLDDRENIELVNSNISKIYESKGEVRKAQKSSKPERDPKKWEKLLGQIKHKTVIPFIGPGLYRVEVESAGKTDVLLYDYLAEQVSEACGIPLNPKEKYKFPGACSNFLKKYDNDYFSLSTLLMEKIKDIRLLPGSWLYKLARIRSFDFFMNTAYDDFLAETMKQVRVSGMNNLFYTPREVIYKDCKGKDLTHSEQKSSSDLLFHIFGHFENGLPAYTERLMILAIQSLIKEIIKPRPDFDGIINKLTTGKLLFLGFEYNDWLFRYLIYTISSAAYGKEGFKLLIEENLKNKGNPQDPFQKFLLILEENNIVEFYPTAGRNFVELLFEEMEKKYPEEIIPPENFPGKAFIGFEGKGRKLKKVQDKHREET